MTAGQGALPSMSTFRYQDLQVWQEGVGLVKGYYSLLKQFPRDEQFALAAQGKRAIVSVVLNIAEGSSRRTDKDFSLYVNHALGSLLEADAVLRIAVELGYVAASIYREFAPALDRQYYKLVAFDKALRRGTGRRSRYSDEAQ